MLTESLYKKNHLRTFTGRYINILDPDPMEIFPVDIAVGLARACRFGGHTKKFYSVAQHSDWCRQAIQLQYPGNDSLAFKALMHDAHEFLLCDIPSPLKMIMPEYDAVAEKLQNAIATRFGCRISPEDQVLINEVDKAALEWEWKTKVERWSGFELTDKDAADIFINHFTKLCKVSHVLQ